MSFITSALATEVIICLFYTICLYIRSFYRELRFKLNLLNEMELTNQEMQNALKVYIEYHIEILDFINLTQKIFRWIIFTEFVNIIFNICNYAFQTSLVKSYGSTISYIFYVMIIFVHLYFLCYFGSVVAEEVSNHAFKKMIYLFL